MARTQTIAPYVPDRVELGYVASGQWTDVDIGKAVKLRDSSTVEICADTNEIYGFVTAVEPYTQGGYAVMAVACDAGREMWVTDQDGGLAVGNVVVAGDPVAVGTDLTYKQYVQVAGTPASVIQTWIVVAITTGAANSDVLIRKI